MNPLDRFNQIWAVDFEFSTGSDLNSDPLCMVAIELRSNQTVRMWREELRARSRAPFDTGPNAVMVAYSATAELDCFLSLGWPQPRNVIDLYAEYLAINNPTPLNQRKLLHAMEAYGLVHMAPGEKREMQEKAMTQTVWSEADKLEMLDYCEQDTRSDIQLLKAMQLEIDVPLALMRGRYQEAVAAMRRVGIPVNAPLYRDMIANWDAIKLHFIGRDGAPFGVYEGTSWRDHLFAEYLVRNDMFWSVTPTGRPKTDDETWKKMARIYPHIEPLRSLRSNIVELKFGEMPIASDDYSRCWLAPFWTATGRNQPNPAEFIFAMPGWMRALIKPRPGYGIAYLDWTAQEVVIMAAQSGDPALREDVLSGDPYLAFGRRAKLIPDSATKKTHGVERDGFKRAVLGPAYGMTCYGLAAAIRVPVPRAREILARQQVLYRKFFEWQGNAVATAQFTGKVSTDFGWTLQVGADTRPRTVMNFFCQAAGAEMMRCAAIAATEAGIRVCCPVHDAFLIEAPLNELDEAIEHMRSIMERAALVVTGGIPVRADADTVVRWPDSFPSRAKGGRDTWGEVLGVLRRLGVRVA